jgi:hypothetical protein
MGCCGLFKKHNKNKIDGQGFTVRPVQQTVNGGNVGYHPSSQQQYQYGGSGGGYHQQNPNHAATLAANRAVARGVAMGEWAGGTVGFVIWL